MTIEKLKELLDKEIAKDHPSTHPYYDNFNYDGRISFIADAMESYAKYMAITFRERTCLEDVLYSPTQDFEIAYDEFVRNKDMDDAKK